jgi:DNA-binding NarL/FixJ family response regulator
MTIRVVLADDHPLVRQGLGAMLRSIDDIDVVGEAANGHDAIRLAVEMAPAVIVLDIHMPGLDGITAAREIRRAAPAVGILMLTMLGDEESARAALAAGAAGYVLKGDSPEKVVRAIRSVAGGDTFLTADVAHHLLAAPASHGIGPLAHLTPREQRILALLAAGHSTATIAARLGVASKTVSNNLSTIFTKLGVTNRTEAAVLAHRIGLGSDRR